jgi:hypothetical protein
VRRCAERLRNDLCGFNGASQVAREDCGWPFRHGEAGERAAEATGSITSCGGEGAVCLPLHHTSNIRLTLAVANQVESRFSDH